MIQRKPQHKVRDAETTDTPTITTLLSELNREEGYATAADPEAIAAALFGKNREVALSALVAEVEGRVVAVLLYYPGYDTLSTSVGYHLADMIVAGAHRRAGIGRALVKALAEEARRTQKGWISLTALKANRNAQSFYDALGMTKVEVDFFAIGARAIAQL